MFSFADTPMKFIGLIVLFTVCTIWSAYELSRPQGHRQRISNGLHLIMSVVMLAMVSHATWKPLESAIPMSVWIAVFALSIVWFLVLAVQSRGERHLCLHYVGHAAMFAAMTWHLSAMAVMMGAMASTPMDDMAGMDESAGMSHSLDSTTVIAIIGLPLMAYLLYAAVRDLIAALRPSAMTLHGHAVMGMAGCHEQRAVGTATFRGAAWSGFAMNFGMFWMSTGLIAAVLPFMRAL